MRNPTEQTNAGATGTARHVLVLGGRGRLGLAAAQAFAAAGWRVFAQVRPGTVVPDVDGIIWLPVAPDDTALLAAAVGQAQVVVHALNPTYTTWEARAMPLLEAGLRIARRLGARLMLPGNVYNFGAGMPALLDEHTPQRATTRKGRVRVAMEERLRDEAAGGGVHSVVLRAGDFFGSSRGSWFDLVVAKDIVRGEMGYPGALDVPTAWAYLPDLAHAFVRTAEAMLRAPQRVAPFDVFHFQGHSLAGRQWADPLRDVAWDEGWLAPDGELRVGTLPWRLLSAGGWLVPMWRELVEMRYLWQTPHALSGAKLAALIGPEPRTELSLAVRESLARLGKMRPTACNAPLWA